jgi:DNA-binding NarL/FixJ family response regulator
MSETQELPVDVKQPLIIIACRSTLLRAAVASMLRALGCDVTAREIAGGQEAGRAVDDETLAAIRKGGDLCLLLADDLNGATGNAIRRLHVADPQLPVVVLGAHADPDVVLSALHAGARGFVSTAVGGDSLLCALKAAMSGSTVIWSGDTDVVRGGLAALGYTPGACLRGQLGLALRQHEIIRLLAADQSTGQIAVTLCLAPKTIENCLTLIYAKLGVHSHGEAVTLSIRDGLVDLPVRPAHAALLL